MPKRPYLFKGKTFMAGSKSEVLRMNNMTVNSKNEKLVKKLPAKR